MKAKGILTAVLATGVLLLAPGFDGARVLKGLPYAFALNGTTQRCPSVSHQGRILEPLHPGEAVNAAPCGLQQSSGLRDAVNDLGDDRSVFLRAH